MLHRFGNVVVLLLLFDFFASVNATGDCFVLNTTWDATINQGVNNITTKVILFTQPFAVET